jgi:aryl-alcohol dehydrogenase-like predicted oxidoreductase
VSQVAIAWVLSRGDDIVPIIGSRRPDQLADAAAALDVELSSDQLAQLDAAFPVGVASGDRYPTAAMSHLPVS